MNQSLFNQTRRTLTLTHKLTSSLGYYKPSSFTQIIQSNLCRRSPPKQVRCVGADGAPQVRTRYQTTHVGPRILKEMLSQDAANGAQRHLINYHRLAQLIFGFTRIQNLEGKSLQSHDVEILDTKLLGKS